MMGSLPISISLRLISLRTGICIHSAWQGSDNKVQRSLSTLFGYFPDAPSFAIFIVSSLRDPLLASRVFTALDTTNCNGNYHQKNKRKSTHMQINPRVYLWIKVVNLLHLQLHLHGLRFPDGGCRGSLQFCTRGRLGVVWLGHHH